MYQPTKEHQCLTRQGGPSAMTLFIYLYVYTYTSVKAP